MDTRSLATAISRVPQRLEREVKFAMQGHGAYFIKQMGKRFGAQLQDGKNPTRNRLASRTGALRRSMRSRVVRRGGVDGVKLIATVGNARTASYVHTQEDGATIRGNPMLTIPLPDNLTAAGRVRFPSARALMGDPSTKTFIAKSKRGNLIIFRKMSDGSLRALWVLKRSVTIKPRLGFVKTWTSKRVATDRHKRLENAVASALSAFRRGEATR